MINKLKSEVPEALEQASKGEFDLLDLPKDQLEKLSETEREQYILRKSKLGESYRGKSLCLNQECVKKLAKIFESVNKNFLAYVQEVNQQKRSKREKTKRANTVTVDQFTTSFKPKT
jgi:hypothetical protein